MSTLAYALAKATTGFRVTNAVLNFIESCFRKVSRTLLGKSWAHLIPSVREQIFQTLGAAT
ncbi:hypothetical protein H4R19_004800, partial [Coemansia spiralis]